MLFCIKRRLHCRKLRDFIKEFLSDKFRYYWDDCYFVLSGDSIVESCVILLRSFYQINLDIIGMIAILY